MMSLSFVLLMTQVVEIAHANINTKAGTQNPHLSVHSVGETTMEELAGKDAYRYLSVLSGKTPLFHRPDTNEEDIPSDVVNEWIQHSSVFVGTRDHPLIQSFGKINKSFAEMLSTLDHRDSHLIHSFTSTQTNKTSVVCTGATPRATLYCVYSLMETFGIRFFLTHDVLPPADASFKLATLYKTFTPRFGVRGLQPFHDFPMGPDFWQPQFWAALSSQMAKMKLNFWGFHTYPTSPSPGAIAEPLVWIGNTSGYDHATGDVLEAGAYDTSWYLTTDFWSEGTRNVRGNVPGQKSVNTSSFCCGASLAYDRDCYGSQAQVGLCYPTSKTASAQVFNNAAKLVRDAFAWSSTYAGVDGCVGIEIPLSLPPTIAGSSGSTLQETYEGIFGRIIASKINITTFWLWTSENVENHSNGKGLPQSNPLWARLVAEIKVALAALKAVNGTFSLGTNGWCLGPGDNASYFDHEISDKTFKVSAINGALGWLPPDPAFADMDGSRAWAIPWMEDDLSLAGEELWVNRTLVHANLAHGYGTDGLLGLMWRTWETEPQIMALAQSAWDDSITDVSIYTDFCASNFGQATATRCAQLFLEVDSFSAIHRPNTGVTGGGSKLPRDGQTCCGGPMVATQVPASHLLNTSGFDDWLTSVEGDDNVERATRWVKLFRYHRQTQLVSNATAVLAASGGRPIDVALPVARSVVELYAHMITLLLEISTTPGEMGMIAAHEGANWPSKFGPVVEQFINGRDTCTYDMADAGCYFDNSTTPSSRSYPYTAWIKGATSYATCSAACFNAHKNFSYAAVEFGVACFCGASLPMSKSLPRSACDAIKCNANSSESCGGADIMLAFKFECTSGNTPNGTNGLHLNYTYVGVPRMYRTATRTTIARSEQNFTLEVVVLSATPPAVVTLSVLEEGNTTLSVEMVLAVDPLTGRIHSQVYVATVPIPAIDLFSYHVTATVSAVATPPQALRIPTVGDQTIVVV